ncbi:MAG: hypothetical protein ACR2GZ_08215 [Solirubrobacteraceae bacterium]
MVDAAIGLLPCTPFAETTVRPIAVPPAARALSTLSQLDYEDAFLADTSLAPDRTCEQWARAVLEDAPVTVRSALVSGWSALGLRLDFSRSQRFVLGWEVRHNTPDYLLLAAGSRIGMPAELLFKRQQPNLLFATFVRQENPIARAVWAAVEPVHRPVVLYVLEHAAGRRRP